MALPPTIVLRCATIVTPPNYCNAGGEVDRDDSRGDHELFSDGTIEEEGAERHESDDVTATALSNRRASSNMSPAQAREPHPLHCFERFHALRLATPAEVGLKCRT